MEGSEGVCEMGLTKKLLAVVWSKSRLVTGSKDFGQKNPIDSKLSWNALRLNRGRKARGIVTIVHRAHEEMLGQYSVVGMHNAVK